MCPVIGIGDRVVVTSTVSELVGSHNHRRGGSGRRNGRRVGSAVDGGEVRDTRVDCGDITRDKVAGRLARGEGHRHRRIVSSAIGNGARGERHRRGGGVDGETESGTKGAPVPRLVACPNLPIIRSGRT